MRKYACTLWSPVRSSEAGLFLCLKALAEGHTITTFARNPSKLPLDASKNVQAVSILRDSPFSPMVENCSKMNNYQRRAGQRRSLQDGRRGKGCGYLLSGINQISARSIVPGTFTNPYSAIMIAVRQYGMKRISVVGTPRVQDPQDRDATMASLTVLASTHWRMSLGKKSSLLANSSTTKPKTSIGPCFIPGH